MTIPKGPNNSLQTFHYIYFVGQTFHYNYIGVIPFHGGCKHPAAARTWELYN